MTSEQRVTSNNSDAKQVNEKDVRQEQSKSSAADEIQLSNNQNEWTRCDRSELDARQGTKNAKVRRLLAVW